MGCFCCCYVPLQSLQGKGRRRCSVFCVMLGFRVWKFPFFFFPRNFTFYAWSWCSGAAVVAWIVISVFYLYKNCLAAYLGDYRTLETGRPVQQPRVDNSTTSMNPDISFAACSVSRSVPTTPRIYPSDDDEEGSHSFEAGFWHCGKCCFTKFILLTSLDFFWFFYWQ
jgi:hypothetical protein